MAFGQARDGDAMFTVVSQLPPELVPELPNLRAGGPTSPEHTGLALVRQELAPYTMSSPAREEADTLRNSTSWRATRPLRTVGGFLRRRGK